MRMTRQDEANRLGRGTILTLAGVLVLAAALRVPELGRDSVWMDEAVSWFQARDGFFEMLRRTAQDNYPPLHNVVLWLTIKLFGDGEAALRAPSALFGLATILAVFALGRELGGTRAGLIAAFALALAPIEIVQSRNARMYTLFSLTATLFLWAAARHLRRPSSANAVAGGIAALAMLHAHLYGSFVFASAIAAVLALHLATGAPDRRAVIGWVSAQGVALLLFLPWLAILFGRARALSGSGFWIREPTAERIGVMVTQVLPLPALLLCGVVLAAGVALIFRARQGGQRAKSVAFVAITVTGAIALSYGISLMVMPVMSPRYFIFAVPAVLAVTGAVLAIPSVPAVARWGATALLAISLAAPAWRAISEPGFHRDWRALAAKHAELAWPDEPIVIYPRHAQLAFLYYGGGGNPPPRLLTGSTGELASEPGHRVWFALRATGPEESRWLTEINARTGRVAEHRFDFHWLQLHSFVSEGDAQSQ
ncbi:glycosyltransferase family 39 protein [Oricola sp.]|uniref:glycosyltransferase family 39 protein n=1 Tax=Oricola sp. TaxID=1979950 RepID=UPI0025F61E2D|nr:glycosyltransferase family 39 protein [Oricola sp.]MCI5078438.1 glycosyltransferase family 39 protein [Oricola sp.]